MVKDENPALLLHGSFSLLPISCWQPQPVLVYNSVYGLSLHKWQDSYMLSDVMMDALIVE
jgi:hypothetical protein